MKKYDLKVDEERFDETILHGTVEEKIVMLEDCIDDGQKMGKDYYSDGLLASSIAVLAAWSAVFNGHILLLVTFATILLCYAVKYLGLYKSETWKVEQREKYIEILRESLVRPEWGVTEIE